LSNGYPYEPYYEPYPSPPYYPPYEKKSHLTEYLLIGGLATLGIGAGLYYLLSKKNGTNGGTKCVDYKTQETCEGANCPTCENGHCHWWSNNTCKMYSEDTTPCQNLISCYPEKEGWQECDSYKNLCRCNGQGYELLEEYSDICINDIGYYKCTIKADGYVGCMRYRDWGGDECIPPPPTGHGVAQGCSCAKAPCQTQCFCEEDDKCVIRALYTTDTGNVSALHNNMTCWDDGEGTTSYCQYWLPEGPWAASTLTGALRWKWGALWPGEGVSIGIFGVYYMGDGYRINTLYEESKSFVSGDTGKWDIQNATFPLQGIHALVFAIDGVVSNIHVDYFTGTLG
jgi:hypothetical protein